MNVGIKINCVEFFNDYTVKEDPMNGYFWAVLVVAVSAFLIPGVHLIRKGSRESSPPTVSVDKPGDHKLQCGMFCCFFAVLILVAGIIGYSIHR